MGLGLFVWLDLGFFFFQAGVKYIQHSLGKDGNTSFFFEKTKTIL